MITKIKIFFTGSYSEFKKVIWPSRKQVISHTLIVIISIFVAMAIIAIIDAGFFYTIESLINRK